MAGSSSLKQTMEKTLREFLEGYQDANAKQDAALVSRLLVPDCVRQFGPSSMLKALGAPPDAAMSNEAYQAAVAKELPVGGVRSSDISGVVIDVEGKAGAARTTYHGEYSDGQKLSMEFAWFLNFTDDGTKVTKIYEFCDSTEAVKHQHNIDRLTEENGKQ